MIGLIESERQLIVGALDSLAVALVEDGHEWTDGERAIYEQAQKLLGVDPIKEPPEAA